LITFFTIPKPFEGHIGVIQRNALASWLYVAPDVQVIVLGEAPGGLDVEHVPELARNEHGTPLLDDAFRIAEERARYPIMSFVNADILLPQSLAAAVTTTARHSDRFLMVGECWNTRSETPLQPDAIQWHAQARKRGADAIDYFVYSRGLYGDLPAFAIGRTVFDNWLVWRARDLGATVVDATSTVHALHQDHSYGHVGSLGDVRDGQEALENRRLSGGGRRERLYSRFDATHRLVGGRLLPNPLGVAHLGETARRAWAKLGYTTGLRRT
jgi:hypothetical protein